MNLDFSSDERRFREEVRTWLRANVPRERGPGDGPGARAFDCAWQRLQYDAGWAGIAWPVEYGGRGLSLVQQMIWYEEYALARGPLSGACFVGLNHAGPTLIHCGSERQKRDHLQPILRGDAVWCQGFSEPGAGSDLAGLQTRAQVDGDSLVVSGQKIWTSHADLADYQELLVRTDPDASRHGGITWVIGDMRAPGIEIRPIRTMAGVSHFSQVYYDQVRIPLSNVVGEIDDGWSVAISTLAFERGTAFMAEQVDLAQTVEDLIDYARRHPGPGGSRPAIRDESIALRLAGLRAEVAALRAMTYASVSRALREDTPGPEGSIVKLYFSEVKQRSYRLAMEVLGAESLELTPYEVKWTQPYLRSYAASIAGGTSEIQRNIIAERMLGLPKHR